MMIAIFKILLAIDYPGKRTGLKMSALFNGYGFAMIIALIMGRTIIGKKFRTVLVKRFKGKLEHVRYLFLLEYIPLLISFGVLVAFKIMQQQQLWSSLVFAMSYILLTIMFFCSFCWATAITEIDRNRKNQDKK